MLGIINSLPLTTTTTGSFKELGPKVQENSSVQLLASLKIPFTCTTTLQKFMQNTVCLPADSSRHRDGIISLCSALVRPHPALLITIHGRHGQTGEVPMRAMKMIKGLENLPREERLELSLFSLEKAQGRHHHSIPVLKGVATKKMEALSSKGSTWRRQGAKGTSFTRRGFISHWGNLPKDMVESPFLEVFKMGLERVLSSLT